MHQVNCKCGKTRGPSPADSVWGDGHGLAHSATRCMRRCKCRKVGLTGDGDVLISGGWQHSDDECVYLDAVLF